MGSNVLVKLLGICLLVLAVAVPVGQRTGDFPGVFLDPAAAVMVFGGVLAILLITQRGATWAGFLRFATFRGGTIGDEGREQLAGFLRTGSRAALAFGLFGQIIGIILMLMNMADPAAIGPGIALSLISLLYGIVLSEMVFVPMHSVLTREASGKQKPIPKTGLYLVMIVSLLMLGKFFILTTSMSEIKQYDNFTEAVESIRQEIGMNE